MSGKKLMAYLELSSAMIIVGSTVVVGKVITSSFPVFLASGLRFAISSMILLPMLLKVNAGFPALRRKDVSILFLQSFAGNFLFSIFLLYGLRLTSAAESGIIIGTTSVVIGLISFLFLREKMAWNSSAGVVLATFGVVVINVLGGSLHVEQGSKPILGNLLVLGAVIGEALWTILGKVVSGKVTSLTIASLTSFFGLLMFLPFAIYEARSFDFSAVPPAGWIPIVYYGIGTVGAYILWYRGVSKVSASTAGVFTGILPVSAIILSYMILKEPFLWSHWVGIFCVLLAIVLMTWGSPGARHQQT
jgi:drug/metabolite transporter (DMT)-like permease